MAKFVVLYSGGTAPVTPEAAAASMKEWEAWFGKLGKAVVEAGAPFGKSRTVSPSGTQDGGGGNISNGYSVVEAADLGAAAKLVGACPIVKDGGKVHVFELMQM